MGKKSILKELESCDPVPEWHRIPENAWGWCGFNPLFVRVGSTEEFVEAAHWEWKKIFSSNPTSMNEGHENPPAPWEVDPKRFLSESSLCLSLEVL